MATPLIAYARNHQLIDPAAPTLRDIAISLGQCRETCDGALSIDTGEHTGRAAQDRFIVENSASVETVAWGKVNRPMAAQAFRVLASYVRSYLNEQNGYVLHLHAGGAAGARVRLVTTSAAHALFAQYLFQDASKFVPASAPITVLHAPELKADPQLHGTRTGTFIVLDVLSRTILIGGTGYAGEIKKAVFSMLNFALPASGILPMHAAVNVGAAGDSAVFFGLSGTGKTTLSADPSRYLLGDDEHGWSPEGVFNLEGGCYAKTIGLRAAYEPEIWQAVHSRDALLENVVLFVNGDVAWDDATRTENTRGAYPLSALGRVWQKPIVDAPRHVIFLTADAFGVLPPVARLSTDQALYWFLSGYTAKLAGTEAGVARPEPTFSTCFGAPFMPRPATVYARLLRERLSAARADVWLVNTGWVGGGPGEGQRMPIDETRRIVAAILEDELERVPRQAYGRFRLEVPHGIAGVRTSVLDPRAAWSDAVKYDAQEGNLVQRFQGNFAAYMADVSEGVLASGPT